MVSSVKMRRDELSVEIEGKGGYAGREIKKGGEEEGKRGGKHVGGDD